jgi:hypothetical protein
LSFVLWWCFGESYHAFLPDAQHVDNGIVGAQKLTASIFCA